MFDIQKNESMNNLITYGAQKNKMRDHITILNNKISCVVGIFIFGFKKYWKQVFDLKEIQTTQNFKHFFQSKIPNAEKNKSYYQQYSVTRPGAFHKEAMMKQQIYENMLARRSGVDYSPGMQFQSSLFEMEETKELSNQPEKKQIKRCRCGSIKQLRVSSKYCPVGLAIRNAKNWPWR